MVLLLSCCANNGNVLIFGGDFNAVLGSSLEGGDVEFLGTSGLGDRNDRGSNVCTLDSATRLKYFDKVVTTAACFAAGHRALYKNDLVNMDVSYRKLCRQIVGPPPGTNWSLEWHEILHVGMNG